MTTQDAVRSRLQGVKGGSAGMAQAGETVASLLSDDKVRRRFEDVLGARSAGFLSSVLRVSQGSAALRKCDPKTILTAAATAAALDLPIDPNLGFAAIVPYNGSAQFQVMTKGFIQLAMRTGQYRTMNVAEVYEGEIKRRNRITGQIEFDEDGKTSDVVVGYAAYFQLVNGFEKYLYMSVEEIAAHALRYSKAYKSGPWQDNRPAMERKTVLKRLISQWGILSVQMQQAVQTDQAVIRETPDGEVLDYVDSPGGQGEADGLGAGDGMARPVENDDPADGEQDGAPLSADAKAAPAEAPATAARREPF